MDTSAEHDRGGRMAEIVEAHQRKPPTLQEGPVEEPDRLASRQGRAEALVDALRATSALGLAGPSCHGVTLSATLPGVDDHYTLRLAPATRQRLIEWARRAGLPERTLAQRYVDEGLRHDAHPLVQFLDGPSGRRASLLGRGLDVWEVIATIRDNDGSIAQAADYLQVPTGLVEAAASYYGEYKDEIDEEIALNEAEYERGRASLLAAERALRT